MGDNQIEIIYSEEIAKEYEEKRKHAIERSLETYKSAAIAKLEPHS